MVTQAIWQCTLTGLAQTPGAGSLFFILSLPDGNSPLLNSECNSMPSVGSFDPYLKNLSTETGPGGLAAISSYGAADHSAVLIQILLDLSHT